MKKLQAYIADLKLVEKKRSSERTQFSQIQQSFLRHQLEVEDLHEDVITILSSNKPNLSRAIKLLTSFRGSLGQDIWKNASTEVQAQVSSKQGM